MTMTIKQRVAALVEAVSGSVKRGLREMQAGPRSMQGHSNNYMSATTLDPTVLAQAFQQADMGYVTDQATLFELVEEQDTHVYAELAKRRRAVTGRQWQLKPPRDASQSELDRTAELADMLRAIKGFSDFRYDMTDAIGKGFVAIEIEWRLGAEWVPKCFHFEPQRNFRFGQDSRELMYVRSGIEEELLPFKWVRHFHTSKSGYIESQALFRVLCWAYAYKAYNVRDMQRFLEVYGLPLRLGKYPAGISGTQRNELLKAVRNIGNDGAGVVPANMTIDFIQAQGGEVMDFLNAVRYWEAKQSMAILGGTLTSQADGKTSTNALGKVHNEVRREIMLHDVEQNDPTVTHQLVRPVALLNGMFAEDRMPAYETDVTEAVDQKVVVEVLEKAIALGMLIDVDWAHGALQIPRAAEGAEVLRRAAAPTGNPAPADTALVRLAALARAAKDGDTAGAYAAQLAALCAPYEQAQIQQIAAVVAEAGDFAEALEKIEALATRPAGKDWAEALALGLAAANLAGRSEV
jgi:phage gp29-like protein